MLGKSLVFCPSFQTLPRFAVVQASCPLYCQRIGSKANKQQQNPYSWKFLLYLLGIYILNPLILLIVFYKFQAIQILPLLDLSEIPQLSSLQLKKTRDSYWGCSQSLLFQVPVSFLFCYLGLQNSTFNILIHRRLEKLSARWQFLSSIASSGVFKKEQCKNCLKTEISATAKTWGLLDLRWSCLPSIYSLFFSKHHQDFTLQTLCYRHALLFLVELCRN